MFTVAVNDILTRARVKYDHETADQATSFFTDAQLVTWLFEGYVKLYRAVCTLDGGVERFAVSASLASPYTLPAATMRIVGVEVTVGGEPVPLKRFGFHERHRYHDTTQPRWRVSQGALSWSPADAAPGTVTLWYIPVPDPTNFESGDSFDSMEGFDDYLVDYLCLMMAVKEEKGAGEYAALVQNDFNDVMTHAREFSATEVTTVQEVDAACDEYYFNA